ncbi:hypothetical protein [Mesorhizobium amorphae]|uniref:hypothetical protein n=1 Tax=Mesorhizobium amorphae TaxID=71433 RepID=UPI00177D709C|nr:hypothetical protein [Mesorhizobium amorphae]
MRKVLPLAFLVVPFGHAAAADFPNSGIVQGLQDNANLYFTCDPPQIDKLKCHFRQISVPKPTKDETEKRIAKGIADALNASPKEMEACQGMGPTIEALKAGKVPPNTNPEQFTARWNRLPEEERAQTLAILETGAKFCANRNPKMAEAFVRASEDVHGSTCVVSTLSFDQEFTLNPNTNKWQATEQNSDVCGTIAYSELYRAPDSGAFAFWNYSTKNIITNPNGKQWNGQTCSNQDQSEHQFSWQTKDFYLECKYVHLNP